MAQYRAANTPFHISLEFPRQTPLLLGHIFYVFYCNRTDRRGRGEGGQRGRSAVFAGRLGPSVGCWRIAAQAG